jgi:hypothetical protein
MTNEEIIKSIADGYELPVEQVALIWSVICYMDENYDIYFDGSIRPIVEAFIEKTLV